MGSSIGALSIVVTLGLWHLHIRRHPAWSVSTEGRFLVYVGYSFVAFSAYWLAVAPSTAAWECALGSVSALVAVAALLFGHDRLGHVIPAVAEQILDSDDSAQPRPSL
ncbi:hypothetical protein MPRF_56450 [Mycolicibacterium parafortuitum]|uniref:Uncharacterized protein n=1 Tax=Mycolicibacterium parafortuitum TaxID=39692 RepID=A0A7I7UF09_MYCPF|nr:hypothetical protein [Mycolicibacterium parafortuitum]BBY78746.1 hypothetical protein MPRF_56450 [Mycolicibacterium parafortuitum]